MGPITRYGDFKENLRDRRFRPELFWGGAERIITGLFKKLVIADAVALVVDAVFAMADAERIVLLAWLGIIGYLVQLYYDFSGYSDIAIGLGAMFGFRTPEKFWYPYMSGSVTEYWNRWHMTLGTWLRNYLYLPVIRTCKERGMKKQAGDLLALFVTWLFSGIWHGAGWT